MKFVSAIRLARPAEWTKNLFVVPPLLASGLATEPAAQFNCAIAFFAFSFVASGVYCINDAIDWRSDQKHPAKRRRPIPSGELSPRQGYVAGAVWIALGMAISGLTGDFALGAVLAAYLVLQVLYNAGLKRIHMIDAIWLALGFVLRAWAGAVAIDVEPSFWLLASVFFLCLFLAQIKRLCDLESVRQAAAGPSASGRHDEAISAGAGDWSAIEANSRNDVENAPSVAFTWTPPAGYRSVSELTILALVSGVLAVSAYVTYAMSEHALEAVGPHVRGFVFLTPIVVVVLFRAYFDALSGRSDSPLRIFMADPLIVSANILFVVLSILILYAPPVGELLARPFGAG